MIFNKEDYIKNNEFYNKQSLEEFRSYLYSLDFDLIKKKDSMGFCEGNHLPLFNKTFQKMLKRDGRLPSPKDFYNEYRYIDNKSYYDTANYTTKDFEKGLEGRSQRTYTALCRDMYLALLFKESFKGSQIIQTQELDTIYKIDLMMIYNNINYGICAFLDSERGRKRFIEKQRDPHIKRFTNVVYCSLPIKLDSNLNTNKAIMIDEKLETEKFYKKYLVNTNN